MPDDTILRAAAAKNSIGVELVGSRSLSDLGAALAKIFGNVSLVKYFALATPRPDPMSSWLMEDQVTPAQWYVWHRSILVLWAGAVLLSAAAILVRTLALWRNRRLDARLIYSVALLIAVLCWSATQANRNVYEALFVLPLVMLAVLFALSGRAPQGWVNRGATALAWTLGVAAIVSPIAVVATFAPSVVRSTQQRGYLGRSAVFAAGVRLFSLKPTSWAPRASAGSAIPRRRAR